MPAQPSLRRLRKLACVRPPPDQVRGRLSPFGGGIRVRAMASTVDATVGAIVALLFWTALGFSIGRRIFSRTLALPIAPALGWAAHSAATLPIGLTGWEADISLTWFSAFSSLTLMMGLASWVGRSRFAAILVVLFAATGSLRFVLGGLFGARFLDGLLAYPTGFAGWLFQSA